MDGMDWIDLAQDTDLFYFSPHIIVRVIESRRMRWAGHVARMGDRKGAYRVLVGIPEGKTQA